MNHARCTASAFKRAMLQEPIIPIACLLATDTAKTTLSLLVVAFSAREYLGLTQRVEAVTLAIKLRLLKHYEIVYYF